MDKLRELNILFLEDNEVFAKNTIDLLKIYFKSVYHSVSIEGALDIFYDHKVDVIISDIKVVDGNGLDFIKSVREIREDIPIVILSAHKDEDFLFKAIPLNILTYELKPLAYSDFLALLKKISAKFKSCGVENIVAKLNYNHDKKELIEDDRVIDLSSKEVLFIELMLKNRDKIVTKEMIEDFVYEGSKMSDAALKNLIFRVRKKTDTEFVTTISNIGYKLIQT